MRIRIDLKILFFIVFFYFTNQLRIYLILILFTFFHEIGHIIIALTMKVKTEKIEITPFGLSASMNIDISKDAIKEIIISLAGPITSLALAVLFSKSNISIITTQEAVYSNLLIAIFNLIPIYPLDGARFIEAVLHIKCGITKSKIIINEISYITMILITVISSILTYYYKNYAIFFICIVLWSIILKSKH